MKETSIKLIISTALAGLTSYLGALVIPFAILILVNTTDYITGMAKAYITQQLNSRIGVKGIIKKLGYFLLVAVGMVVDWLIQSGMQQAGLEIPFTGAIALLICIWLIINELISILENLAEIGVPVHPWMGKLIEKLKNTAESATKETEEKE